MKHLLKTGGICLALSLLIMSSVQPAQSVFGCLQSRDYGLATLNLSNGLLKVTPLIQFPQEGHVIGDSPDGNHNADLQLADDGMYALQIKTYGVPISDKIRITRKFAPVVGFSPIIAWSFDSNRLAYLWVDAKGKTFVGLADVSGNELNLREIRTSPGDVISFSSNLLDNSVLDLNIRHADSSQDIRYYSMPGLTLLDELPVKTTYSDGDQPYTTWSYTAHRVAYVIMRDSSTHLLLVSPTEKLHQEFDLSSTLQGDTSERFDLKWSPNGQYLAVIVYITRQQIRLGVFGIDKYRVDIAAENLERLDGDEGVLYPAIEWTKDSHSILYSKSASANDPDQSKVLFAFRLKEKRNDLLARLQTWPINMSPDGKHALLIWRESSKVFKGILDINTGQKTGLVLKTDDPDSFIDYHWLHDGKFAWIQWDVGRGKEPTAYVVWSKPDGSDVRQTQFPNEYLDYLSLLMGETSIYHWEEWPDEQYHLVYTRRSVYEGEFSSVWLLNLKDGSYHLLAKDLDRLNVFIAPDKRTVALSKFDVQVSYYVYTLYLAAIDGRPSKSIQLAEGIRTIVWAPDGSALAYLTASNQFEIISRDGKFIQHFDLNKAKDEEGRGFDIFGSNWQWTTCPKN